jgi:Zn-dependent protease
VPELTAEFLALGLIWYLVFFFSTTCHEAAHALVAYRLGDPTAYRAGQVSLNPLPHVRREPFGMILMPLLSYVFSGWMLGWASAPYDPGWAHRYPKKSALMALAGPLANGLLALAAALGIRLGLATGFFQAPAAALEFHLLVEAPAGGFAGGLATLLSIGFSLNLLLGAFNLIPLPPLDGSSVVQLVMGETVARRYQEFLAQQPFLVLVGLLAAWKLGGQVLGYLWVIGVTLLYLGYGSLGP